MTGSAMRTKSGVAKRDIHAFKLPQIWIYSGLDLDYPILAQFLPKFHLHAFSVFI